MNHSLKIFLFVIATTFSSVLCAQVRYTGWYNNPFYRVHDSVFNVRNGILYFAYRDSVGAPTDTTHLSDRINARVKYTDTSGMLTPYLRKTDSTAMLLPYLRKVDSTAMLLPYFRKTDSTAMLLPYLRKVDSTAMLLPYLRKADTAAMLMHYLKEVDTTAMLTPYLREVDTALMLSHYLREVDTTSMLLPYARKLNPIFTAPTLGAASATSLNTGTTLNGVVFVKSTTAISLLSTGHGLTVGNESTGVNVAIGLYLTGVGWQGRNNGLPAATHINADGGDVRLGYNAPAGVYNITGYHTGTGTGDYCSFELRNGSGTVNDAMIVRVLGTNLTTSGPNLQDGGLVMTGSSLSGGLSIGTRGSAAFRVYTNDVLRTTWSATTGDISTTGEVASTGGKLGYATGAGGTVTQGTSRSTSVTLNKLCGTITMFSAAQAADAIVTFTLTNSFITATDFLRVQHISATDGGAWNFSTVCGAGSATITVRNVSNASITSATPLQFIVMKSVNN